MIEINIRYLQSNKQNYSPFKTIIAYRRDITLNQKLKHNEQSEYNDRPRVGSIVRTRQ